MPYTPTGGYYASKPKSPRVRDMKYLSESYRRSGHSGILRPSPSMTPAQKLKVQGFNQRQAGALAGRLGPQPKAGKYAVLICFDTPEQAKTVHRRLVDCMTGVDSPAHSYTVLTKLGMLGARSIALHDCQKHPLNVKY